MSTPAQPIAPKDLYPGQLITPAIRLDRMLGRGGMGSLWVADHLRLKVKVVVKFVAAEYQGDPDVLARFEREAAAAASAKSPHVVQIFDFGVTSTGLPFIAMELLEGEDLAKCLARERRVPPQIFADWLTQACKGLHRAHAMGIVHRDIKPENIFLCNVDGEVFVKLLDFGVAKTFGPAGAYGSTHTHSFLGTIFYMSPEQLMGAKYVDHRTDLWALGVVTYQALTGVRPFEGEAIGPIIEAIRVLTFAPPTTLVPSLDPAVDAWIARALARDPNQRFSSAREMAQTFAQALRSSHVPHLATTYPPPQNSALPWAERRDSTHSPIPPEIHAGPMEQSTGSAASPASADPLTTPRPTRSSRLGWQGRLAHLPTRWALLAAAAFVLPIAVTAAFLLLHRTTIWTNGIVGNSTGNDVPSGMRPPSAFDEPLLPEKAADAGLRDTEDPEPRPLDAGAPMVIADVAPIGRDGGNTSPARPLKPVVGSRDAGGPRSSGGRTTTTNPNKKPDADYDLW